MPKSSVTIHRPHMALPGCKSCTELGNLQDGTSAIEGAVRAHVQDIQAVWSPPRCDIGTVHVDLHDQSPQTHLQVTHTAGPR